MTASASNARPDPDAPNPAAPDPTIGRKTATDPRQHMRMTTDFFTNPGKLAHLTDPVERIAALGVHAASIGLSKAQGGDGHVEPDEVLAALRLPPDYSKILIADGLWHQDDHGCPRCPQPRADCVYVHDFLEHQRSAREDDQRRADMAARGATGAANRWAGHVKKDTGPTGRPPGRPRKHPLPETLPETTAGTPTEAPAAVHPAEARAAARRGRPRFDPDAYAPEVGELCRLLADRVAQNGFAVGTVGATWYNACRLLLERGWPNGTKPLTADQVRKAILWATDDAFWYKNIRSMDNLRKHYERMREDAQDAGRTRKGQVAAPRRGRGGPPAAVSVPGMNALYEADLPGGAA